MKAKAETVTQEPIEISATTTDKTIEQFLNAQTKRTRSTYRTYLKRVVEFSGQTGAQMLLHSVLAF
jgi:hypothetical protein